MKTKKAIKKTAKKVVRKKSTRGKKPVKKKTVKKRVVKKKKVNTVAAEKIPAGLEIIWDDEVKKTWDLLSLKHQALFLVYMGNGFNKTDAYKKVYNPNADPNVAAVSGNHILRNPNIQLLLKKMRDAFYHEFYEIKRVFLEGMDAESTTLFKRLGADKNGHTVEVMEKVLEPNHKIRIDAANALAKINRYIDDPDAGKNEVTNVIVRVKLPERRKE